ncbi:MAG TPA: uroporphyrinogen decarboxylase family protein [Firmicutes bacterium]|nr:uroporphyrinogen decarboxylase family protein [Bacillota bacterium]
MNMIQWLQEADFTKKTMPVLSFPGVQLIGKTVDEMVHSGELQADCMKAIADRYHPLASVSLMDLSVEAEAFGSPVKFSADEVPTVTAPIVDTEEDAQALRIPNVGEKRTGEYIKAIGLAVEKITECPVFAGSIGPFSLAGRLMDMTEIMVKCYTDPEIVHAVLEKATSFLIAYNLAFKKAGANGVVMAEPAAGLLSPDLIEEFSSPYVKRIIEAVEDDNFLIAYHNCGNVIPLIDSILSTGARMLHFGNAVSMEELLPKIPENIRVLGNIDPVSQFRNGTPESMRQAVFSLLDACGKYPHFSISSGCDIPPASPLSNIDAYFDAVSEYHKR